MSYAKNLYRTWHESPLGLTMRVARIFTRIGFTGYNELMRDLVEDIEKLCPDIDKLSEEIAKTILKEAREPKE